MKTETYKRDAVSVDLPRFCPFAKPGDTLEVCEWANMDGFTLTLSTANRKSPLDFTYGEFAGLQAAVLALQYKEAPNGC